MDEIGDRIVANFGVSSKGKPVLIDEHNFSYYLSYKSTTRSKWTCVEYRKGPKCPATAIVNEVDNTIITK